MADHAFLLSLSNLLYVTDNDVDINFGGIPYLADDKLLVVEAISDVSGSIPDVVFQIICPENSASYVLLSSDPGPISGVINFVEKGAAAWESIWTFTGILSQGGMVNYVYRGTIEHVIKWKLGTRKPIFWTDSMQKARYPGDEGLEYVHEIEDIENSISWKGIEA